ncbi:craniofacial development protein 2-like [Montipora capricornis]|uniref:craniofacial development protein 2-like n=1 Tax=Montipora capricornis TaxID=246305 RepID=UPI0035F15E83
MCHALGFAVRNSLLSTITPPTGGSKRLLTMRMTASTGPVTFICAYAPTLTSTADEKDRLYEALDATIKSVPNKKGLYILGDFNARVGAHHKAWPTSLGRLRVGKMNENGQRLLELCSFYKLAITNTFFENMARHKVSWRRPRSKHWHQLDLILARRQDLNSVRNTRSYHSA